jgi:hypothetical protein
VTNGATSRGSNRDQNEPLGEIGELSVSEDICENVFQLMMDSISLDGIMPMDGAAIPRMNGRTSAVFDFLLSSWYCYAIRGFIVPFL